MTDSHDHHDRHINRRGSLVNYVTGTLQGAVLLFQVLGARFFGAHAYGAYRWAWAVTEVALQIGVWGLNHAVLRGVAAAAATHDVEARERTIRTATAAVLVWSSLAALPLIVAPELLFGSRLPDSAGTALRWLAPMIPLWAAMMVLVFATMGTRSMRSNLLVRGLTYPLALNLALLLLALLWRVGGERALSLSHVIAAGAALLAGAATFRHVFHELPTLEWRLPRWDRRVFHFAAPVGASETVNQALTRIDMVLLGVLWPNTRELAAYGAAMLLAEGVSGLRYAMDPLLGAIVAHTHTSGDRERLRHNLTEMVNWATGIACPIALVFIIWGDAWLALWGPHYASAWRVLIILATAHLVNASLGLHQWVVVMTGRPTLDLMNNICALIAGAIVCTIAIPRLGLEGAALGALTAMIVLRGAQYVEAWWLEGVQGLSWRMVNIATAAIASAAIQLGIRHEWGPSAVAAVAATALGLVAYLAITRPPWSQFRQPPPELSATSELPGSSPSS